MEVDESSPLPPPKIVSTVFVRIAGIQDMDENLNDGQRETRTIDDRWEILFYLDEKREGQHARRLSVFLVPVPTARELHEASDIWARSINWTIELLTKNQTPIARPKTLRKTFAVGHRRTNGYGWSQFCREDAIFSHVTVVQDDEFLIKSIIEEDNVHPLTEISGTGQKLMMKIAQRLTESETGDICFVGSLFEGRCLYAHKHILSESSEYFKARFSKEWSNGATIHRSSTGKPISSATMSPEIAKSIVLNPAETTTMEIDEQGGATDLNNTPSLDDVGRDILHVDGFHFVTLHNLLYFLYTGYVNMHFNGPGFDFPDGYPELEVSPFELYRLADMYMVQALVDRCFRFLVHTNSAENISRRLFNIQCEPYQDLRKVYMDFLIANHSKVITTDAWKETLLQTENLGPAERRYWGELLLDITAKLCQCTPREPEN